MVNKFSPVWHRYLGQDCRAVSKLRPYLFMCGPNTLIVMVMKCLLNGLRLHAGTEVRHAVPLRLSISRFHGTFSFISVGFFNSFSDDPSFFAWAATANQGSPSMVERHIIPYVYKPRYLPAMPTAQRMHKHDNAQVVVISIATGVPKNTCGYLSCKGPIIHGKIIAEHAG